MWQPIAIGKTLDYIASRGIKGMVTLNGEKIVDDVFRGYQEAAARAGRTLKLGEDLCWGVGMYLANTQEEAMRRVEPAHDERYKWFAPFGFVRYADEQGRTWGTPGAPARTPSLKDGVEQKAWLCGPPSLAIEIIKEFQAKYPGLDQMMIHWAEGIPPKEFKQQLRRFAKEVMPAFLPGRGRMLRAAAKINGKRKVVRMAAKRKAPAKKVRSGATVRRSGSGAARTRRKAG
jgi:hypothetical protein